MSDERHFLLGVAMKNQAKQLSRKKLLAMGRYLDGPNNTNGCLQYWIVLKVAEKV